MLEEPLVLVRRLRQSELEEAILALGLVLEVLPILHHPIHQEGLLVPVPLLVELHMDSLQVLADWFV